MGNGTSAKKSKAPTVFAYLSDEEKRALEIWATLENRSVSNLVRVEIVKLLKAKGLLVEELDTSGEITQRVETQNVSIAPAAEGE